MHIYRELSSDTMVFQYYFIVALYSIGVMLSPGYLIRFNNEISCTHFISVLYGLMSNTAWIYVTFILTGICDWWIKKMCLFPCDLQILARIV